MMQEFQNALYTNVVDPSSAVIYDRVWSLETIHRLGLVVFAIEQPELRGYQWRMLMARREMGLEEADFPNDDAPKGRWEAPILQVPLDWIGLEEDVEASSSHPPANTPPT
jgi:hypothetical protein